jgi:predicted phage tail protein
MGIMSDKTSLALCITTALRGAGGGGGGSARQPIESPDSLRSIAYARIVDLVSEGEIYGFSDQENPLSCVFLNETPVANADASLNFRNIQIDSRVGTQTQDPLPNFDGVESELGVGVELRAETPWTRSITNLEIDSIRVRLSTPQMTKHNTTNGDTTGTTVSYKIELQTDGGSFVTKLTSAFSGKTTTKYERSHRIELPPATTGWLIRVTRLTPNSDSGSLQNATYIESIAEIIEVKLRMPMSALVSLIVDAEQFNNIPSRAYRLKGRIIRVPSNYDPDTREYTGVWDGTFQSRWSNNPAWVFYDMALNSRYGLGHLVPQELVDKWTLYRIAQYCDGLVDDGMGGQEPRFTCNLVLQSQADALKVMQDLATVFRGVIYATGGSVTAVGDMPEDPVYTYTAANVVGGKFTYSGTDRRVRHTVAMVSWSDLYDFGRAKVEPVEDEYGISRYGIQQTDIIAIGCTSRGQARRWGRYVLATERFETDAVAFDVGMDGTIVAPGKVVYIADPLRAGERRGGRIVGASIDTVTVDMMSVSAVVGDTLVVTLPNGVAQRREIATIDENAFTVTPDFSSIPVAQSVWAVDSVDIPLQPYRIVAVSEAKGQAALGFQLHGIQHQPGKFAYADTGVMFDLPGIPDIPRGAVPAPTGLTVTHRDVVDQNTAVKVVNLSWDAVLVANSYNVLWRQSAGQWIDLGTTGFTNIDILGVLPGGFEVQVMAINVAGVRSVPAFGGPYDIPGVGTPPGYVEEINNNISQEIIDRFNADADVAAAAAIDAQNRADAALAAANAHSDVIAAQVADILAADEWNAVDTYPEGDLVQYVGKLYRAITENTNQQPDTNPDDWQYIGDYASLGEAVAAAIDMSTVNASDIEAVATDLSVVVARLPAGSGELATSASVATEASARASADTAAAGRLTTLEARMPGGSGVLATAAALSSLDTRVTTAEGTISSTSSALTALTARVGTAETNISDSATAITLLTARVTSTEGDVTSQASSITDLRAGIGTATTNPNILSNPTWEADTIGWTTTGTGGAWARTGPDANGAYSTFTAPGVGNNRIVYSDVPVNTIAAYTLSADLFSTNATGTIGIQMQFYNVSNTLIGTSVTVTAAVSLNAWMRYAVTLNAPAGTTYIRCRVIANGTTSNTFARRVKLERSATATPYNTDSSVGDSARATTLLEARVTSAEGSITSQASSITSLTSSLAGKADVTALTALTTRVSTVEGDGAGSGNLIVNSNFSIDDANWSSTVSGGTWLGGRDYPNNTWYPPGLHNLSSHIASSSSTYRDRSQIVPVTAGKRYVFSAWCAALRSGVTLYVQFRNAAGTVLSTLTSATLSAGSGAGTVPASSTLDAWTRVTTPFGTAPATSVNARVIFRTQGLSAAGGSYGWMIRPMFEEATTAQTLPSPYSSGGFEASATYTLRLDVNGYVTGWNFVNDGTSGDFSIVADNFAIVAPGGGARTEYSAGNWRVYDAGGTLRVRMGVW